MDKVKELLSQGARSVFFKLTVLKYPISSPNTPCAAGWHPLHEAAASNKAGAEVIVRLLVEAGARYTHSKSAPRLDISRLDVSDTAEGITPLHDAVVYGSREVVMELLAAGAETGRKL